MERVEPRAVQRQDLVGLVEGPQHRIAGARADVGRYGLAHARRGKAGVVEEAAAEKEVRGRAEDRHRPGLRQRAPLAPGQMDAMAEEAARAEQAVAFVDPEVILRLGVEGQGEVDLGPVLRQVGLDEGARRLGGQGLRHLHLRRGRGDREARRDRHMGAAPAVPGGEQGLRVVIGGLRGVAHPVGAVAVHHHLAADHPHSPRRGGGEIGLGRSGMRRAKGDTGRGALTQQLVEEGPGDARGMGRVGEPRFGREDIAVQPFEQLLAPGGHHLRLRQVDMGIDEARKQQVRAVVAERGTGGGQRGHRVMRADRCHPAVAHEDGAILVTGEGGGVLRACRLVEEPQDAAAQQKIGHGAGAPWQQRGKIAGSGTACQTKPPLEKHAGAASHSMRH